ESQLLDRIEGIGVKRIAVIFSEPAGSPMLEAETEAAGVLLVETRKMIDYQTSAWSDAVDQMRGEWAETLEAQKKSLDESLRAGVDVTLTDHADQLHELRTTFFEQLAQASQELENNRRALVETEQNLKVEFRSELNSLWSQWQASAAEFQS